MKVLIAIFLSIIINSTFGQTGGLKGRVTLGRNIFTSGLRLEILNQDSVIALAFTDQVGEYVFKNIKTGTYDLRIQFIGYRHKIIKDITIIPDEVKELDIDFPGPCIESVKKCPKGHTNNLIPIVYGMPGEKLRRAEEKGRVKLGGCEVTDCDPKWYCAEHDVEF